MIDIDEQVRTVLSLQAEAMVVPDTQPDHLKLVTVQTLRRRSSRPPVAAALAAAAAVILVIVGLVVLQQQHEPGPGAGSEGPQTLFDGGVDMIVFMRHGASPEQVEVVRYTILQEVDVIDTQRVEYLDADQSLALARRMFASNPGALAQVEPAMPTMFRLHALPQTTRDQLAELGRAFLAAPNVIDVTLSDPTSDAGTGIHCVPTPCLPLPTVQDQTQPTPTEPSPTTP